jgi:hypothetical protein
MRPELAALVDWLRESGRMAEVNYPRLVHQVDDLLGQAAFIAHDRYDLDRLACATEGVQTHLEATVRDQDAVALALLLENLLALARFVGENSERLLVATGVLTDEEINDWVDEAALSPWCTQVMSSRPPPGRFVT